MLISPALAHGTSSGDAGGYGPLVLLGVASAVIVFLVVERKMRGLKSKRDGDGE